VWLQNTPTTIKPSDLHYFLVSIKRYIAISGIELLEPFVASEPLGKLIWRQQKKLWLRNQEIYTDLSCMTKLRIPRSGGMVVLPYMIPSTSSSKKAGPRFSTLSLPFLCAYICLNYVFVCVRISSSSTFLFCLSNSLLVNMVCRNGQKDL